MQEVLDTIGLQVPDAGAGDGRDPASRQEEDAHHRQIPDALKGVGGDRLQHRDRLFLGQRWRRVLLDAWGFDRGDVLGGLPGDQPLGGELVVGAAQDRQPPRHGRRGPACLK
jgi:hypothetical protein